MPANSSGAGLYGPHPTIPGLYIGLTDNTSTLGIDPAVFVIFRGVSPDTTANVYHHGCIAIIVSDGANTDSIYENIGTYAVPVWALISEVAGSPTSPYTLLTAANFASTTANASGATGTLTLTNPQYFTSGNTGEYTLTGTPTYGTGSNVGTTGLAQALTDAGALYTALAAKTGTAIITPSAIDGDNYGYGTGVFVPGVYTTASAIGMTAAKTITLNGVGDYVFVSTGGAITFGATDVIKLTNGAVASRVYWVANAAINVGANDVIKGNLMSGTGATITIGSTCNIEGRLLSKAAVTIDGTATSIYLPLA